MRERIIATALAGLAAALLASAAVATDCNRNGVTDSADIAAGTSADCNANAVPDECDVPSVGLVLDYARTLPFTVLDPIAALDVDRDGDDDLLVSGYDIGLALLSNSGDATFSAPVSIAPLVAAYLFTGHFDADAIPDLLVVSGIGGSGSAHVLLGLASGGLASPLTVALPSLNYAPTVADLNGDGRDDLLIPNADNSGVAVWFAALDGRLTAAADVPVEGGVYVVLAADVDNDGNTDIVALTGDAESKLRVLWGDGQGGTTGSTPLRTSNSQVGGALAIGDLDHDGDRDVIATTFVLSTATAQVFKHLGVRQFAGPMAVPLDSNAVVMRVAELDGDEIADLVVGGHDGVTIVHGIDGDRFAPPIRYAGRATATAVTDLDGDRHLDVAAIAFADPLLVLRNRGDGRFAAPLLLRPDESIALHALADYDRDGDLDVVVVAPESDAVTVYRSDGHDLFVPIGREAVGGGPYAFAVGDLDGDAYPEVVTANRNASTVSVLSNSAGGGLGAAQSVDVFTSPSDVVIGELTSAAPPDLAVARLQSSGVAIFEGQTDGGFAAADNLPLGLPPYALVGRDLDADGDMDLAVLTEPVQVRINQGAAGFASAPSVAMGRLSQLIAEDVSGDARPDLIGVGEQAIQIARGRGDGTFAAPVGVSFDAFTSGRVAVADVDGDGDRDLVVSRAAFDSRVAVLANRGDGSFAPLASWEVDDGPQTLALGDLDGDRSIDVSLGTSDGVLLIANLAPPSTAADCDHNRVPDSCQMTSGMPPPCLTCLGDCDADRRVTVDELVVAVTIALGQRPLSACGGLDADLDGAVSISELVRAVAAALGDCGGG